MKNKTILVVDNSTQYGQLYVKRLRDFGIKVDYKEAGISKDKKGRFIRPKVRLRDVRCYAGIIVAGGKSSVTVPEDQRVDIEPKIYTDFKRPILGTCFGHQDMVDRLDGEVVSGLKQCGPVYTHIDRSNPFFANLEDLIQRVNSTHNDGVKTIPKGFKIIAKSYNELNYVDNIDAIYKKADVGKNNYRIGTQFHPETFLTKNGDIMLKNFLNMCKLQPKKRKNPNIEKIVQEQYKIIKKVIGNKKVLIGISGGIDSSVATKMLLEAGIDKKQLIAIHIDTGYNRFGESKKVVKEYHKMGWNFVQLIDKKKIFNNFSLSEQELEKLNPKLKNKGFGGIKLKDALYSEHKRLLFQAAYDKVIDEILKKNGIDETNSILVQGTNQADKVESGKGGRKNSHSAHIKTHHNVGKLSEKYEKFGNLLEPLDRFYKSDNFRLGEIYGLPKFFLKRKPYPGPGLLLRIGNHDMVESGVYTKQDIKDLSKIANKYSKKYKVSTYVTPLEAVGNFGDERAEGVISIIKSKNKNKDIVDSIKNLEDVAGQLPHYTTFSKEKCITRFITPLFDFDSRKKPSYTKLNNAGDTTKYLRKFDKEVNKIVKDLKLDMTQVVNYVISDNLGEDGKYTFVFRPWLAPDLMSGMPYIPKDRKLRKELINRLKQLKTKYDFIGNICIDLTYKPNGGTEVI